MKYIKLAIAMTTVFLSLTACGGGGNGGGNGATMMTRGTPYTLKKGQNIVKTTEDTVLVLETDIQTGVTTATLQKGSAEIR